LWNVHQPQHFKLWLLVEISSGDVRHPGKYFSGDIPSGSGLQDNYCELLSKIMSLTQ